MMYQFNWEYLILPEFINELRDMAKLDSDQISDMEVIAPLTAILRATGGVPIALSDWDAGHRIQVVKKLLHEAITKLLKHRYGYQNTLYGLDANNSGNQVDVNHASYEELESLPIIGDVFAKRIIESRRKYGAFLSTEDFAERIKGISVKMAKKLIGNIVIKAHGDPFYPNISGSFAKDFESILGIKQKQGHTNILLDLLEELAVFVAGNPHPSSQNNTRRMDLEPLSFEQINKTPVLASQVKLLPDTEYYEELSSLLEKAENSIDICMFYIALGKKDHPTQKLLEILVSKAAQHKKVRVLVDKDGKDDPYGSHIINKKAATYLSENGVTVRTDEQEKLLHSKFVLIDSHVVIIGSHNWTKGSYFDYSDLSLTLKGEEANAIWKERFQKLWDISAPFSVVSP
ncbi:MAG: phospholipase D-like domain-containing protein [Saonia sp.]